MWSPYQIGLEDRSGGMAEFICGEKKMRKEDAKWVIVVILY
jgi:hypothetical protein